MRKIAAFAIAGFAALGTGPAAQAGQTCVLNKVCVGISIYCPAEGGEPGCICVDHWVHGYHIYYCL